MKIMITGANGLVGRNISEVLSNQFDLLLPSHRELDLLNFTDVLDYVKHSQPDLIVHCAGKVGGIQANINEPVNFLVENLDMGRNIIMAAYQNGIKKLINLGSSCMYPRNAPNPLKEEYILQGELEPTNEGYALAKIASQRLCSYIMKEKPEYSYKTLLPCNLYGKYDKFDLSHAHMIPAAIHKVHDAKINNSDVQIWGSGNVRREFMYAGDLADCIVYSIENFTSLPELLNIGTGKDYSINEYYQAVADVVGFTGPFSHDLAKPEGMKQKLVDTSKAADFGWFSKTALHTGIEQTYKYYLDQLRMQK